MKTITFAMIMVFGSTCLLQARSMERMRSDSRNISIDTKSLKKSSAVKNPRENSASTQYEIQPTPVDPIQPAPADPIQGLAKLISNIFKLLFGPNGDIEIANPSMDVPDVEGTLPDDTEEEDYVEGYDYTLLDPNDYEDYSFFQQAQQPAQQVTPGSENKGEGIPADLRRKALEQFNSNSGKISNKRFIGIVDFARHSSKSRFWILDTQNGSSYAMHVAHGTGSDQDADGYATRFSNVPNSRASSLGVYVTGALYTGKHGRSIRLHGISPTNSNALSRAVVLHQSNYVREANVRQGRSFGCLAVSTTEIANVLASLKGGAMIYAGLSNSEF